MLLDCSSGIEPFFALIYYKEVMSGQKLRYVNSHLKEELKKLGLDKEEIIEEIESTGTLQHIKEIPEEIRKIYVTAMDINAEDHIKMQAAFQKHVDNSISKTINFSNSATREDVKQGYLLAWENGLKGCTVYRDGSRQEQVLSLNNKKEAEKTVEKEPEQNSHQNFEEIIPPPLPQITEEREHASLNKKEIIHNKKCPECANKIQVAEGCMLCLNCGFSACAA